MSREVSGKKTRGARRRSVGEGELHTIPPTSAEAESEHCLVTKQPTSVVAMDVEMALTAAGSCTDSRWTTAVRAIVFR